jgi:CheY-like chemotaxis protein/anti-sigma regulatory factor (Ser/Thr protein kinase)
MPTILVVDDSPVDRALVGGLLQKDTGWCVQYAADGAEAISALERSPVDLVVTDLMMPKVGGFEVVTAVRNRFPDVPVILMTSHGSEEIAVRALREGAASYVPKRFLAQRLRSTVSQVLAASAHQRRHRRLLGCMTRHRCDFVLHNDYAMLAPLVVYLQEIAAQIGVCDVTERTRIGVAIEEALVNALHHGNLEVTSDLRGVCDDGYYDLIARRCREPLYANRRIFVEAELTRDRAVVVVRDEGRGFDRAAVPDPLDPAGLERTSGRGLLLMRTFMDEVLFNDAGNAVTMIKRRKVEA